MKTFEKVLEIFREYLDCDLEEEVLPCREGYLRVTWNGDSRYCVDGLLSRTPDELFEVLLSDYRSYEELRLTKGCREVTEEDERQAEILCQSFRERWKKNEGDLVHSETAVEDFNGSGDSVADPVRLDLCGDCLCLRFGAGAYQHGGCPAGCGSSDYLLLAKRHYPAGDSISH